MSRFDGARWARIMVWTGATLAWGAAFTTADLEPSRAEPVAPDPPTPLAVPTTVQAAVPDAPARGLVILRYTPSETPRAEVRTVYVTRAAAAPTPAPPGPAPESSGS